ncbi:uncharacterized protein LOC109884283 isoform X3 [Oncorhynchus kisutch]|uniref:uncharacterized protein LOC109884283 isoform X3 n=1 Tax=Oncorhynchus kisutch TaxID=8019 RepID=UPI0012DFCD92|nr:uncharacterized protein LOC109884283 isoform X3 [Oncorhynchus kisutch]
MDSSVPIVNQNQSTQPLQLQPAMLTQQAWPAGTQQILIPSSWQQVPGVAIHGSTHQSVVTESPVETLLPDTGQQTHSWRGSQYSGMLQQNLGVNSRSGARKRAKGSRGNSRTTRGVSGVSRLTNAVLQFSLSQSSSWTRPARRSASSPSSQMRRTRGSSTPPVQPQTSYINPKLANRHPCSSGDGSNRHRLVPSQSHPLNLSQEESRYRTTYHNRTKRRGDRQRQQERQRCQDNWTWEQNLDYTTWEEIDRWAVDSGRVPEPAWDSLEQCEEGYRRMELEKRARRRGRKPIDK